MTFCTDALQIILLDIYQNYEYTTKGNNLLSKSFGAYYLSMDNYTFKYQAISTKILLEWFNLFVVDDFSKNKSCIGRSNNRAITLALWFVYNKQA